MARKLRLEFEGAVSAVDYGMRGNSRALGRFICAAMFSWLYWLDHRSAEKNVRAQLWRLLNERFGLPAPRLVHGAAAFQST